MKKSKMFMLIVLIYCQTIFASSVFYGKVLDTTEQERSYTVMERELEYLMNIMPGEYDNVEQLDFDSYYAKKEGELGRHLRFHAIVERIDVPALGEHVIYTEAYVDNDLNKVFGQSIYIFSTDEEAKRIKARRFNLREANPQRALENKGMDFLKSLTPDDNRLNERCELIFERVGDEFVGKSPSLACHKDMARNGIVMHFEMRIRENLFAFKLPRYDVNKEELLPDNQQTSWYMLEKARCFACMIDFPKEERGRPTVTKHYITIHDQGGKFEFDYDDGRHMVLGMRNTWSLGMQRETFVIFIQEGDEKGKTLIYSWGEPGADRIGFNPGWIRVQCDLNTPKNVAFQKRLRPGS
ncbi:CpcT/CpeT family chromophore lyase [Maribacter sp. 2210JD10-5]|uniref:CpcT/CpeT family chromophore lyase n=1 Tax=Maribacter sp. 2210JD10-5 TaxID=3386272 RepID=UPI0039BC273D